MTAVGVFLFVICFAAVIWYICDFIGHINTKEDLHNAIHSHRAPLLVLAVFLLFMIGYIPNDMMRTQACNVQVLNETVSGNTTTYAYGEVCTANSQGPDIGQRIFTNYQRFVWMFIMYWAISFLILMGRALKMKVKGRRK